MDKARKALFIPHIAKTWMNNSMNFSFEIPARYRLIQFFVVAVMVVKYGWVVFETKLQALKVTHIYNIWLVSKRKLSQI